MAAKVVMVAVPAVLGAASIRVYRVSDLPAEGLVTRERLNIYYPLHSSAQLQHVQEQPGVIERGFSSARITIEPVVHSIQRAYMSVKTTTLNCYHTGQGMYYYLKDPPPEFLPRFGSITMAGLLGMFLARKGSHLRRIALPMGLMTAGASVCYPPQAIAVIKVTGKKMYAAGQWTSESVSSLLSSPPKPPAAEKTAASPKEKESVAVVESVTSTEASSESPVQTSTVHDTEEKPLATEELVPSVGSVAETTVKQPSTEPSTDFVMSVGPETKTLPPPEEPPIVVEVEETLTEPELVVTESAETSEIQAVSTEETTLRTAPATEEPTGDSDKVVELEVTLGPVGAAVEEASVPVTSVKAAKETEKVVESAEPEPEVVATVQQSRAPSLPTPEERTSEILKEPPIESVVPEAKCPTAADVELSEEPSPLLEEPAPESAKEPPPTEESTAPAAPLSPEEPAPEPSKEAAGFKADPALMDFGQSDPEDADLYSTRS